MRRVGRQERRGARRGADGRAWADLRWAPACPNAFYEVAPNGVMEIDGFRYVIKMSSEAKNFYRKSLRKPLEGIGEWKRFYM